MIFMMINIKSVLETTLMLAYNLGINWRIKWCRSYYDILLLYGYAQFEYNLIYRGLIATFYWNEIQFVVLETDSLIS